MRIFTIFMLAIFATFSLQAQLFVIESPESIAGSYEFGTKANDGTGTEWLPGSDMVDSIWCGNLELLVDATDPVNDGCEPATNDLTGKIAVIDRGVCNFSLKVYEAQVAGATGAIIINNVAADGIVNMLGGDFADQVTIPAIFLTFEDGELLKGALGDGVVSACMGAIVFNNNLTISFASTTVPRYGVVPSNQITEASPITQISPLLANVSNSGLTNQTNANVSATIDFTPNGGSASEVYSAAAGTIPLVEPDSTEMTTFTTDFDYTGSAMGDYTITYTLESDSIDQGDFDNEVTNTFTVSENVYCRGNWDAENNRPANTAFVGCGTTSCEILSGFRVPNGEGLQVDSITFGIITNDAGMTLDGISVTARLYEWTDLNGDNLVQSGDGETELTIIGVGSADFTGSTETSEWRTITEIVPLTSGAITLSDDMNVFLGLRYENNATTPRAVFFAYNENYNHEMMVPDPIVATDEYTELDFPHLFVDFGAAPVSIPPIEEATFVSFDGININFLSMSHAMYVNPIPTSTKDVLSDLDAKLNLFPNPVADLLTAEVTLSDVSDITYKVTDATGRLIYTTKVQSVKTDNPQFNVAQLPAGQYFLTIQTDKGIRTESFNVNR